MSREMSPITVGQLKYYLRNTPDYVLIYVEKNTADNVRRLIEKRESDVL